MNIVEEDAPGHEAHVHTWWDFAFDEQLLERHLAALVNKTNTHPSMSGAALVELFLAQSRRQREVRRKCLVLFFFFFSVS